MKSVFWIGLILLTSLVSISYVGGEDMTDKIIYPEYWYQQGVSEYLLKHYDRALYLLDVAISQDPNLADAWYWRGITLGILGDNQGSKDSIAKAKELNPMVDNPYSRRVGPIADLAITPVPTQRILEEAEQPQRVETTIDLSKQPDPTGPDLVFTSFEPRVREGNTQLEIKATIANQGYRPSTDFFITFYTSDVKPVTKDDTPIGYYLITNLMPGTEKQITGYFPMERMTPGSFYIGAIADPSNQIMEVSEDNNAIVSSSKITIPDVKSRAFQVVTGSVPLYVEEMEKDTRFADKRPDLTITKVSAPTEAKQGGTITVDTIVKNQGSAAAGAFRISLYLSPDAIISESDRVLGFGDVPDLGPGMMREGSAVANIPADLKPGSYYVGVMVDSEKAVAEENESNNVMFADKKITITAPDRQPEPEKVYLPDIVVQELSSDLEGTPGSIMNVTTSIRNIGQADAGRFIVELYLSPDKQLSSEDILIGMGEVPGLPAGTQSDGTASAPIPEDLTPGIYYFGIFVDSEDDLTESDKENNVGFASVPITITKRT